MKEINGTVVKGEKGNAKITRENQKKYHTEVDVIPDELNTEITRERIDKLMKSAGENQVTLARRLGYADGSSLSRAMRAENPDTKANEQPRKFPLVILIKLAKHYNVTTDYLLGLTEFPEPNHMGDSEQLEHSLYCSMSSMLNSLSKDRRQHLLEKLMEDNK